MWSSWYYVQDVPRDTQLTVNDPRVWVLITLQKVSSRRWIPPGRALHNREAVQRPRQEGGCPHSVHIPLLMSVTTAECVCLQPPCRTAAVWWRHLLFWNRDGRWSHSSNSDTHTHTRVWMETVGRFSHTGLKSVPVYGSKHVSVLRRVPHTHRQMSQFAIYLHVTRYLLSWSLVSWAETRAQEFVWWIRLPLGKILC